MTKRSNNSKRTKTNVARTKTRSASIPIAQYVQQKENLLSQITASVRPVFERFLQECQSAIGEPDGEAGLECWPFHLACVLEPEREPQDSYRNIRLIVDQYAKFAGLRYQETLHCNEHDKLGLKFECRALTDLFNVELGTPLSAHACIEISGDEYFENSTILLTLSEIHLLDLRELAIVGSRIDAYWSATAEWMKSRENT